MDKLTVVLAVLMLSFAPCRFISAQMQDVQLGMGNNDGLTVTASNATVSGSEYTTLSQEGFLPNLNAASRFLSQATLGYAMEDIEYVAEIGVEDWIAEELQKVPSFSLLDKVIEYHEIRKAGENDPDVGPYSTYIENAWWQYHMTSNDKLRQRVAFALSEFLVISKKSSLSNEPYAFGDYYDMLLEHSFGNYRDLLTDVTYHNAMGIYLTYLNNPKTDTTSNTFPDENYARELMQLFTIGLHELNPDGSIKLDNNNEPIPTYDNMDILEFSKIFTGLTWADHSNWGRSYALDDTSYTLPMVMWDEYHEPGAKLLLNNFEVPDRDPVDGNADIADALDNLFNHQNMAPFLVKYLIQRLVTSNPDPTYVERVVQVFEDNGNGVRGDLGAVVTAILVDPVARSCESGDLTDFGMLREPYVRYIQLSKAFDNSTLSGNHRNVLRDVYEAIEQTPFSSPSVFNFFQSDYQPIGAIEQAGLSAPEFQITNSVTITGYINGLYTWIVNENLAQEWDLYSGENNADYEDELSILDFSDEEQLATDEHLHILIDRLNLILAGGKLSTLTENIIIDMIKELPADDADDLRYRVKTAIYFVMSSPEYLINR